MFVNLRVLDGSSLSARRAWIEIAVDSASGTLSDVALRKESVDRNLVAPLLATGGPRSLSARRAWIEIVQLVNGGGRLNCRSPQGERG